MLTEGDRGAPGANGDAPGDLPAATDPEHLMERVQELSAELELVADPAARQSAEELVSAVIELYGSGLERIFVALEGGGEEVVAVRESLTSDGLVASLMLIHGLFPVELEARVLEALDSVRPYMESHGGNVEFLGLDEGVARIRLEGSCESCPASSSTLELAIKQALDEAAPDLEGLIVEGLEEPGPSPLGEGATELPVLQVAPGRAEAEPAWFDLEGVERLEEGARTRAEIRGIELIVARIEGDLLAYRDACAGCGERFGSGELSDGVLACEACGKRYFLPRAGRSLDGEGLQLEPVPLLSGDSGVRVALAA